MKLNILCIGDIVGRPGRVVLAEKLHTMVKELNVDCVIANAENAAGGSGLTAQIYDKLLRYGVNLVTLGDHTYRKRDIIQTLETADYIVRPRKFFTICRRKRRRYLSNRQGPDSCGRSLDRQSIYEARRVPV